MHVSKDFNINSKCRTSRPRLACMEGRFYIPNCMYSLIEKRFKKYECENGDS